MTPAIEAWLPKSVLLLRKYDRHKFISDLIAGVTVGLVALPLAMAFAIASGVPPQAGLYCAIVTGFLVSALGGSKTQIGGPTGAFVVVIAGIIAKHGIDGLFVCTMMAGVILVVLGVTGMGTMVKYFPRPVVVGFTNGIAILIASTQIRDFFGLRMDHVPGDFFHRMKALGEAWNTFSVPATAVSILSIAVMVFCLKYAKKIPGAILVTFGAHPRRGRCCAGLLRRLARASAASPAACRRSPFRRFITTSSANCYRPHSLSRCWERSSRSCPRSFLGLKYPCGQGRHGAAPKPKHHREDGLAVQAYQPEYTVHHYRQAREVAGILKYSERHEKGRRNGQDYRYGVCDRHRDNPVLADEKLL